MKTKQRIARIVICAILVILNPAADAGDVFNFAGFTFDQRNTADQAARLGNGVNLGGAQFSLGFAETTTGLIANFPQGDTGFDTALSLAQLTGLNAGLRAVNLPFGNLGITTRHGIETSWHGHRALPNLGGDDIVIYESASSISGVDGMMVRVRTRPPAVGQQEEWTDWYWYPPDDFQITSGQEGLFAFGLDLSDLGVPFGTTIDRIQMANLILTDRVIGPGTPIGGGTYVGVGKVIFDGSSNVLPDAGSFEADRVLDYSELDPDPLYVAVLQDVVPLPALFFAVSKQGGSISLGLETAAGRWRVESTDSLFPTAWQLVDHFTNTFGGAFYLLDTGQNSRPAPLTVTNRFYRAVSD